MMKSNPDPMCFHECPVCQVRCNCDWIYCVHCEEKNIERTNKEISREEFEIYNNTDGCGNCFSDADPEL